MQGLLVVLEMAFAGLWVHVHVQLAITVADPAYAGGGGARGQMRPV